MSNDTEQVSVQRHGASVNHRRCGRSRRRKKRNEEEVGKKEAGGAHSSVGETIGEGEKSQFASGDVDDVDNVRPRGCVTESDRQFIHSLAACGRR